MFDGHDLVTLPDNELRKVRGAGIAMVFQDPMSSLDPVYRIGDQIVEQIRSTSACPRPRRWTALWS